MAGWDRIGAALRRAAKPGVTRVGWFLKADEAEFIWDAPRSMTVARATPKTAKSVLNCPAVIDYEARTYEVPCPVDLNIRLGRNPEGRPIVVNDAGRASAVNNAKLAKLVHVISPAQWRHPERPVLQISTPYRFISDELVYLNQLPACHHYRREPVPGILIGGRFPIDSWPRPLMWALEWQDTSLPLTLQRGEPWFYIRFETLDPKAQIKLVEAELTPELDRFCRGVDSVTNYVNRTFSLFASARARRPRRLLVERRR